MTASRLPRFVRAAALAACLLAASLVAARRAHAQDSMSTAPPSSEAPSSSGGFASPPAASAGFGGTGVWVLSVGSANAASDSVFLHKTSGGDWELNLHPALDYFLASNVSVGGVLGFDYESGGTTVLDFGGRAGFNANIGDHLGFWPTAGIFVRHQSNPDHSSSNPASLGIFAPFLYHPFAHLFLGLGPSFNLGLNEGNGKEFGIDYVIGGWL